MATHSSQPFGAPDSYSDAEEEARFREYVAKSSGEEIGEWNTLQMFRLLRQAVLTGQRPWAVLADGTAAPSAAQVRGAALYEMHRLYDKWIADAKTDAPARREAKVDVTLQFLEGSDGLLLTWTQLRRREGLHGRERQEAVGERQQRRRRQEAGHSVGVGRPRSRDQVSPTESSGERRRRLARERKRRQREKQYSAP